ncbi:MAG: putative ABC transporter permease [Clostridia bacterium]|nr:putative ABC transporter permease [Clostridia bacterium]
MEALTNLVLLFFAYSFLGWCIEVTLKFIQYHRFINRGFFTGPICPIYGSGAALITLAVGLLSPVESAYGTTFALSFVLCGAVEYFTSYFMEKRFHARWWDYSRKPMNLHGRIWIGNLILFGLGGVAIIHLINPLLYRLFDLVSLDPRRILAAVLLTVFAADYVMTHFVLRLIKNSVESSEADSTEAINREVRLLLSDRNIFYRRFADAYPEVIYRTERINARLAALREESERIRREAERRLEEQKAQLISSMEPSSMIRSSLLDQQRRLIDMLYDEQNASEPARALKREIEANQARLESRPLSRIANLTKAADKP